MPGPCLGYCGSRIPDARVAGVRCGTRSTARHGERVFARSASTTSGMPARRFLLTGGEELAVISKVLGHSDYGTTLKVYAHLDPKRARAAAGRIDAALGRTLPALEDVAL